MNENFKLALKKSGMTKYKLAKKAGLPYTFINELANDKACINNKSVASIIKLAGALNTKIESLVDNFPILDNVSGKYNGIQFKWHDINGTMHLYLKDGKKETIIKTGYELAFPKDAAVYHTIAQLYIEKYIRDKEFEIASKKIKEKYYGENI